MKKKLRRWWGKGLAEKRLLHYTGNWVITLLEAWEGNNLEDVPCLRCPSCTSGALNYPLPPFIHFSTAPNKQAPLALNALSVLTRN